MTPQIRVIFNRGKKSPPSWESDKLKPKIQIAGVSYALLHEFIQCGEIGSFHEQAGVTGAAIEVSLYSKLFSSFQRPGKRNIINKFNICPHGESIGNPGNFHTC
jgi:hypothetical protein